MTPHNIAETHSLATAGSGGRALAISLFGGAILATVASVSLAQTYVANVAALTSTSIGSGTYVALGGYNSQGDGGGGILLPLPASTGACVPDYGLVFQDGATPPDCFVRANPTNSVREWGAKCDVTALTGATWYADPTSGTLSIPNHSLTIPPQSAPIIGETIAISQIGVLTLWGTSTPAVSMTRFSSLGGTQANYKPGDLISFSGGTFSQQAAIIVDAVNTAVNNGTITQWHFLWGGLYQASNAPTSAMAQDNTHSYCGTIDATGSLIGCGNSPGQAGGATLIPAWSGWSLLNNQTTISGGTNYAVGDLVTMTVTGAVVNGPHYATLVVEGTTGGAVTAYDWLDYGSFNITSSSIGSVTAVGSTGMGSGLTFTAGAVTRAPFSTTIVNAGSVRSTGTYFVTLADNPPFLTSGTIAVQYLYYGDDDSGPINRAITAAPKGGVIIPAGCGTTQSINLSPPSAATNANPAQITNVSLRGANFSSSGLYAFTVPNSQRSTTPVLANVIRSGVLSSTNTNAGFVSISGGGLSNMFIEGLGIPEGYGYYGLFENAPTPANYVGPSHGTITNNIPASGNLVEIDAGSLMRIDKVLLEGGGSGPGNAVLQCGLDESDPTGLIGGAIANITITDSRLDTGFNLFGAANPDFVLRLDAGCHDSTYDSNAVFDGTKADILVYNGNLFGRIHVNSDAANSGIPLAATPWPLASTFDLAGLADYGFYVINNTAISETQCDVANKACVFTIPNTLDKSLTPGQITDTQMKCGSYVNTPPGYSGVELADQTANTTVSGTSPSTQCTIFPFQLVKLDGSLDPSTSLCNNSYASVAGCTGYQGSLASQQSYTQPATSYVSSTVTSTGLFAMPFVSPAVGATITRLGINVMSPGTATTQCLVGIYNSAAEAPQSLVAIGTLASPGTVASAMGTLTISTTGSFPASIKASLPNPGAQLAPETLYFFAVACNNTAVIEGVVGQSATVSGGGLSAPLVGASLLPSTSTQITAATWSYPTSAPIVLPNPFGSATLTPNQWVPNVYAEP